MQKQSGSCDDESIYVCLQYKDNCVEQHITAVMITHHLPGSVSCLYLPYLYNINQHICQPNAKVQEPLLENNKSQCPRLWHPYLRRHSICCLQRGHTPVIAAKGRNLLPTSCQNQISICQNQKFLLSQPYSFALQVHYYV